MRVLLIVNNFPSEGNVQDGVFNLRAAIALRQAGVHVSVLRFVPYGSSFSRTLRGHRIPRERYEVDGIVVHVVRGLVGPKRWGLGYLRLTAGPSLARIVEDLNPDIVHAHGLLHAGLLALESGRPYVVTGHGSETYALPWRRPGLQRLAERVVRGASTVAAVSRFVAAHLERLGACDVNVIPNGADERVFFPSERRPSERPVIFFAGNLVRAKGIFELLAAAAMLDDLAPRVVIAGDGADRRAAALYASERGIDTQFLGRVAQPEIAAAMREADVVTLPSYAEGLPTVLCEAMLSGRAIVATDVGGIGDIVRDGHTGYIVQPRDSDALAEALRRVVGDAELRVRMEDAAVRFARQHLTWRSVATRYASLYGKAITACRGESVAGGAAP